MTRGEFLKKTTLGALSLVMLSKLNVLAAGTVTVNDNLATGGTHIGSSSPSNKKLMWLDTSSGGVLKYYDGVEWVPTLSTWST